MKEIVLLSDDTTLVERTRHGALSAEEIARLANPAVEEGLPTALPAQAADVLLTHGRIEDPRRLDGARECLWIAERDWVYRIPFPRPRAAAQRRVYLHCLGLDTIADLYLNGTAIGQSRDMYLPFRAEVTHLLRDANILLIHFHSPHAWIAAQPFPPAWEGVVHRNRLMRKPHEDFNSFNGAFPYFTPIGIFDRVQLEVVDGVEFADLHCGYTLRSDRTIAELSIVATLADAPMDRAPATVRVRVHDPAGACIAEGEASFREGRATVPLTVDAPALWWPRGYGAQPLYRVSAELHCDEAVADRISRTIGFREIALGPDFALRVNDVPVKLWGANFVPLEQFTHVWPAGRIPRLLDLAENAGMVTLRLWGPGAPYGDNLYEECDRRGILVWSELYHTWGMYPDSPDFIALCQAEAEHHVKRLRHHPCVFLWCGGNEVHMGADLTHPGRPLVSRQLFHEVYPRVCRELDPTRYYHADSPVGGAFPNDPDEGDTHGYTHFWFVRGCQYPILLTENARWSPPGLKTLRQYIPDPEKLWPRGFVSRIRHRRAPASGPGSPSAGLNNDGRLDTRDIHEDGLLPPAWQLLGKDGGITNGRVGPIGDFYETGDTPEGLIHRIGSAHALFLRREIERLRRGRPAHEAGKPRRTQGHYWWRFNGTWPLIDSELVDYLLEPKQAYYAARRAQASLLLSFEFGDRIHLWVTNDSPAAFAGMVRFELLRMSGGAPVQQLERQLTVSAGSSEIVLNLDSLGMFRRDLILLARLLDAQGGERGRATDFAYEERNLVFPAAQLELRADGPDAIVVGTDVFARCVELQGEAPTGDAFGWDFEDNFFDLVPGERKRIRLLGRHRRGRITARAFFGGEAATVQL